MAESFHQNTLFISGNVSNCLYQGMFQIDLAVYTVDHKAHKSFRFTFQPTSSTGSNNQ